MNTKEVKTTSVQPPSTTDPDTVFADEGSGKPRKNGRPFSGAVIATMIGVLLLGALGGFVAGAQVGKTSSATASQRDGGPGGAGGQMGGPGAMNGTFGEVTAVSSTSITVKDQRSSESTTYKINDDTKITDGGNTAAVTDITKGDTVMIATSDSDDTTASSIKLNPSMGGPRGDTRSSSNDSSSSTSENQT